MRHLILLSLGFQSLSGCTAGGVGVAGSNGTITPFVNAKVSFETCVANQGMQYQTTATTAQGQFLFYGENADATINPATYVPAGPVTVSVTSPTDPNQVRYFQYDHEYDLTCQGLSGPIPCSKDQLMWTWAPVDPVSAGVHVRYPVSQAQQDLIVAQDKACNCSHVDATGLVPPKLKVTYLNSPANYQASCDGDFTAEATPGWTAPPTGGIDQSFSLGTLPTTQAGCQATHVHVSFSELANGVWKSLGTIDQGFVWQANYCTGGTVVSPMLPDWGPSVTKYRTSGAAWTTVVVGGVATKSALPVTAAWATD